MSQEKQLSVAIVSYNTHLITVEAVERVLVTEPNAEVIVIDNNSTDTSVKELRSKFGSKINVIQNHENVGFAGANNQAAEIAVGKYLMLLNSDAFVNDGTLDRLKSDLELDSSLGAVAASLQNSDGSYQPQGGALPTLLSLAVWWLWPMPGSLPLIPAYQDTCEPQGNMPVRRGWVGGTAVMLRRKEYLSLAGLDEKIFMYAEDIDICRRLKDLGLHVAIDPMAKVTHLGSASGSAAFARLSEIRGLLYLFQKFEPIWKTYLLRLILIKGSLLRYLLFGILSGSKEARNSYRQIIKISLGQKYASK